MYVFMYVMWVIENLQDMSRRQQVVQLDRTHREA